MNEHEWEKTVDHRCPAWTGYAWEVCKHCGLWRLKIKGARYGWAISAGDPLLLDWMEDMPDCNEVRLRKALR